MALSNWDTLALNEKGKVLSGSWESFKKVGIEIYKAFIYVRDKKAWNDKDYKYGQQHTHNATCGLLFELSIQLLYFRCSQARDAVN